MADYLHGEDGKIHTRYSELVRCTPGQIDRVIAERTSGFARFESADMEFGTVRHDMWRDEALKTRQTAACFGFTFEASYIEVEFAAEILPGVILHSRPDAVSIPAQAVLDYKTLIADTYEEGLAKAHQAYAQSKQLPVYAYQLGLNGIMIKQLFYLIEIWDRDRDNILGYAHIRKAVGMTEIAKIIPWIQSRVSMLAAALDGVTA